MAWFDVKNDDGKEFDISEWESSNGMYGEKANENSIIDELNQEELDAVLTSNDFTDVYNQSVDTGVVADTDPFIDITEAGNKANVLGLPLNFCKTADPCGRTYKDTIMQDIPYVFLLPGKATLNGKLIDGNGNKIKKNQIIKDIESMEEGKFAVRNPRTGADLRFLGFRADYANYFKYVQTMLSTLHATMGLQGIFNFDNEYSTSFINHGLVFYADKSTSISEDASNDYTESQFVQSANDKATLAREVRLIAGFDANVKDFDSTSVDNMADQITGSNGIISRAFSGIGRVLNGSQLLYPEIWADSKFDRSYTLNFKFYSPYGDKESIFKYVYVPFISLLALALPRQDSTLGYGQPFVLRLSAPGWFESSMGAVTSIQFTKGGQDDLWTIDGLPQEIDVTVNIKDLYPTLTSTKKYGMLTYNLGLSSFLDTMAGIRTDQLDVVLRGKTFMKTRLSIPSKIINSGKEWVSDWSYQLQQGFNNLIR